MRECTACHHPTQLYEGAVALLGSLFALALLLRSVAALPTGSAFAAWLMVYAVGRAAIEMVRADPGWGLCAGVSTARWTSIAIVLVAFVLVAMREVKGGVDARAA